MNSKKANHTFLVTVILYILVIYMIAFFCPDMADSVMGGNLIVEGIILLPITLTLIFSKEKIVDFCGFHKMKTGTVLMTVLYTFLTLPLLTLLNLFSQLFVDNEVVAMMENMNLTPDSYWKLILSTVIIAPFVEELTCRGMYYRSYAKSSKLSAMLISALLFAVIHMNFNQASYAFGMGILAVLLVEVTGSLWSSILYHALINGSQTIPMLLILKSDPEYLLSQTTEITDTTIEMGLGVYLIVAAVTLPLAFAVLFWIGEHEGRTGMITKIWKSRKNDTKKDKSITLSLITALILCFLMMTGLLPQAVNYLYYSIMGT